MIPGNITTNSLKGAASSPALSRKNKLEELAKRVKESSCLDVNLDTPLSAPERAAKQRARATMGFVYKAAPAASLPLKEAPSRRLKRLAPRKDDEEIIIFLDEDSSQSLHPAAAASPAVIPAAKRPTASKVDEEDRASDLEGDGSVNEPPPPLAAPNIRVQNKYLPAGLVHKQSPFYSGMRDTAWLKTPHVLLQTVASLVSCYRPVSVTPLDLGDLNATYYTTTPGDWTSPALRRTFIMAGRGDEAMLPQEEEGGRIILVIPKKDEAHFITRSWPNIDILVIDQLKTPLNGVEGAQDLGLLSIRRLATYLFALRFGLKHLMMLDDNVASVYLSRKLGFPASWMAVYILFRDASSGGGIPYITASTYRPDRDHEPLGEELYVETPAFNSKIAFMDVEAIFSKIPDPKTLLPLNLKYWGEDYFRQYVLHFSGIKVGVLPTSLMLIRRSKKAQSIAAQSHLKADCWLTDTTPLAKLPLAVHHAVYRIQVEVRRNLHMCVEKPSEEEMDAADEALAKQLEQQLLQDEVEASWDALDQYRAEMNPEEDEPEPEYEYIHVFDPFIERDNKRDHLPPLTPKQFRLLSRPELPKLPVDPILPASIDSDVVFPAQHPDYRFLISLQKRYAHMPHFGQNVMEQRWEVITFVQFMNEDRVACMFPVGCVFDADLRKKSDIADEYLEIFNKSDFQSFVKGHLNAITQYLELYHSPLTLTPLPKHIFGEFINKARTLLHHGYDILPLEEYRFYTPSGIDFDKGIRIREKKGDYDFKAPLVRRQKIVRDPNKLLAHIQKAFEKTLTLRSVDFDAKIFAMKERGFNESLSWTEAHAERVHELARKDEAAQGSIEALRTCLKGEGKSARYETEARALLPPNFTGMLMPYQIEGFLWGKNRLEVTEGKVGVALCDDMGLGKTLQTIALLAYSYHVSPNGPTLILCPSSVTEYWKEELAKFLPSKRVMVYAGSPLKRRQMQWNSDPIVIATYETFREDSSLMTNEHIRAATNKIVKLGNVQLNEVLETLCSIKWIDKERHAIKNPVLSDLDPLRNKLGLDEDKLKKFNNALFELQKKLHENWCKLPIAQINNWHGIVLDEAHHIKNASSLNAQIILGLKARYRIALTGTPVQNTLKDLYPLMNFIIPGFFLSDNEVNNKFFMPIKEATDEIRKASRTKKSKTFQPLSDAALMRLPAVKYARQQMQHLRDMIRPFFLRRLKEDAEIQNQITLFRNIQVDQLSAEDEKVSYELTPEQKILIHHIYNSHRAEIMDDINQKLSLFGLSTGSRKTSSSFAHLLQLQQICTDPSMVQKKALKGYLEALLAPRMQQNEEEKRKHDLLVNTFQKLINGERFESGKINACVNLVLTKLREDPSNRVLIFIWFQETAQRLQEKLAHEGYNVHIITGNTDKKERHRLVKKFNGLVSLDDFDAAVWDRLIQLNVIDVSGKLLVNRAADIPLNFASPEMNERVMSVLKESLKPVFILNIAAGGEGINLQASNIVIDFDTWWNPASMDQAFARAKRIGQKRHVQHYTMSSAEVHIDNLIEQNLKQKRILQELIIGLGPVDPCLLKLRDYISDNLQRNGF